MSMLGTAVARKEDPALLTVGGKYVDDLVAANALHAAFVRSPMAHGEIRSIDGEVSTMLIPYTQLSNPALRAIVLEFVSRDGTDHSSIDQRVESVLGQLEKGRVQIDFDSETETCNIVPV